MTGDGDGGDFGFDGGIGMDFAEQRLAAQLIGEFLGWTRRSPQWLFRILWGQEWRPNRLSGSRSQ